MAISAINSVNVNNVAFKGTETASKAQVQADDENFLEENKEALLGLSAIGLAVLGAVALHRKGQADKAATQVVQGIQDKTIGKLSVEDRQYLKTVQHMQQIIENEKIENTIAEFGPEGTRHAARIAEEYEKALPEIFAEGAKVNSREDLLAYNRVLEAKQAGKNINPDDFAAYARVEGLDLSDFANKAKNAGLNLSDFVK